MPGAGRRAGRQRPAPGIHACGRFRPPVISSSLRGMTSPIEGFCSIPEAVEKAGAAALRGALESGALVASALLADGRIVAMIPECWWRAITRAVVLRDGFGRRLARGRPESVAPFEAAMAGRAGRHRNPPQRALRLGGWPGDDRGRRARPLAGRGTRRDRRDRRARPALRHASRRARACAALAEGGALGPVAQEAAELAAWIRSAHPEAPPPTAKTIENRIQSAHRRHRAG